MRTLFLWLTLCALLLLPPVLAADEQAFLLTFNVADGKYTLLSSEVVPGPAPNQFYEQDGFRVIENDGNNGVLHEQGIGEPTLVTLIGAGEPEEPSMFYKERINFTVIIPYHAEAESITLLDDEGKKVLEADLGKGASRDEDGSFIVPLLILLLVLILLLALFFWRRDRKPKKGGGKRSKK